MQAQIYQLTDLQLRAICEAIVKETIHSQAAAAIQNNSIDCIPAREAQALLGKDRTTLWRWARKGILIPVRIGGSLYYRKEDISKVIGG